MGREAATRILEVCSGLCREEKPISFRQAEAMLDAFERERGRESERESERERERDQPAFEREREREIEKLLTIKK